MQHLWISLYLPTHSLDVLFPQWFSHHLAGAVLQHERILDVTPAARQLGVEPGLRYSTALSTAPEIQFKQRDLQAEHLRLEQAALSLLAFTPQLTLLDSHSLAMEVSASLQLFGGPRSLWKRVLTALQGLGLQVCLGMAPTAQGAWALARQTHHRFRRVLKLSSLRRRLDPLSLNALPATHKWETWLNSIGCQNLLQLRQLPRKGLQQRCAPSLVQALDAAYGDDTEHYTWFEAPAQFSRRYETSQRLEHTQAIFAIAGRLVEPLCGWLQNRHGAADRLNFTLHHETGRHARPPTLLVLQLSQPGWRPEDFLPVLNEKLNRLELSAPVRVIDLAVQHVHDRSTHNQGLFPEPQQWARQQDKLLDLLQARLGSQCVLQADPYASHLPEQANQWTTIEMHKRPASSTAVTFPPTSCLRPFWLLPTPQALSVRHNRPLYRGQPLRLLQGPERVESGWWTEAGHQQRDYFIAQDASFARYWIYRERGTLNPTWFLHGLFG